MAAGSRTLQVRLLLSAVDRDLEHNTKLVVPRREDEATAHVVLRVLAYCLFYRAGHPHGGLHLAPGPADRDGPDLLARDLANRPVEWIICGDPAIDDLRHVLQHQRGAKVRILLGSSQERERLLGGLRTYRRTLGGLGSVDVQEVDESLIAALARRQEERQRWMVTVVDGHLYVDVDGQSMDGEVFPVTLPSEEALAK